MEGGIFTPVSILKKTRVHEAVNRNVRRERRGVVIVDDIYIVEEEESGDTPHKVVSDPDSEDSALCLKIEDTNSETSNSPPTLDMDHAPTPGMDHTSNKSFLSNFT